MMALWSATPQRVSVFLIALLLAGCGTAASDASTGQPETTPETLGQAQALWSDKGIADYQITVQQSCFCPAYLRQPIRVTVADGKLVDVTGLEQLIQDPSQLDAERLTVPGMFRFIERAERRDVHRLKVDYDPRYGFPVYIDYDGHEMIADDEYQYELSDFQRGAGH
ncbi:DUF6174 domain-containing protein [Marinobacter sediminicola]|uniref:DUF6174 domain-containing protein n=1 Tax=Marinobacter sediminicola TaxID=3072994 RepID=UPI0028125909|nr:DUF6174 domain-containing protein [Marinobacter sp. F26243]